MTERKTSDQFADNYPAPENQLAFELQLRDDLANRFPDFIPIFNEAFAEIQRFAGIDSPKYKVLEESRESAESHGMVDELGYLNIAGGGPNSDASLMLRMPVEHTEEIAGMTDTEKRIASKTHHGMMIISEELPEETVALLSGIYSLVGAKIVRDDRKDGESSGVVVREGQYQGTTVYIAENYTDGSSYYDGLNTLVVRVLGTNAAKITINSLSDTEFKDFVARAGVEPFKSRDIIFDNKVTRENYREVADLMGRTKKIVDNAGSSLEE